MKIGIIGPRSSCDNVERYIREIAPEIQAVCYPRERVNTCDEVVEQCGRECDAYLFTGCAIENFVLEKFALQKPYASIQKSAISVSGALLEMQKRGLELDAFSIDVVENQVIEDLLDAFHIMAQNIYHTSLQPGVDEEEYIQWHEDLQRQGKTNVALTSFAWVHETLVERGCRAIYLGPTRAMVRHALESLQNELALNRAEYSRIAVEIMQISNFEKLQEDYYSSMEAKAELEQQIIHYAKSIQGSFFANGRNEYVIFTNAGILKSAGKQDGILRLQERAKELGMQLNVGIGQGVTAYKADINARKALNCSLKKGKMGIYQVDENDVLEGPLGMERQLKYQLISSDPRIQEIARKTGLSVPSILKISAIAEARQNDIFDAHELAECLEITTRSARRIMNKIMDAGYGRVYAKETAASGGRPKTLIEILFR